MEVFEAVDGEHVIGRFLLAVADFWLDNKKLIHTLLFVIVDA